jgi:DNA-directed RNA polymerase subunit H (RpoH/RPB5)
MRRDYNIQIFLHTNLMFNVTKHKLVKKHRRINGEERKELMKKFHLTNLTLDRLPCITIDDPLSLWHDFRVGEIIRIEEPGMSEKYRIVVDHPPT